MRVPDWFQRRVRAIHPDLYVEWLPREQRFAVMQRLANTPSIETMVNRLASDAYTRVLENGELKSRDEIQAGLYLIVSREAIVFRVENEDGSARPLDERTLTRLRKMAFRVRHFGAKDWVTLFEEDQYEIERRRQATETDMWAYLTKDATLKKVLSDVVWGLKTRHTSTAAPAAAAA